MNNGITIMHCTNLANFNALIFFLIVELTEPLEDNFIKLFSGSVNEQESLEVHNLTAT